MTGQQPNKESRRAHTDDVCALLRLSPRLRCIAEGVPQGACLADIGTDHGFLPAYLLQSGRIARAIASDINAAPLESARRTAARCGVSDRMEFRLCAGLDGFAPDDADTVVIAGMGGETILTILENAPWLLESEIALRLQPMTRTEALRPWLVENGYRIDGERLVLDRGTIYAVLSVSPGEGKALSRAEIWCGADTRHEALYGAYARDRIRKLEEAAAGVRRAKDKDREALRALEADAEALKQSVKEWEDANRS